MLNCDNCKSQCKTLCCGYVPIPDEIIARHQIPFGSDIFKLNGAKVVTKDGMCAYLVDGKCSIYEDRPEVCRKFADESHPLMTCTYQDKDGRIRSRQERRDVTRKISKYFDQRVYRNQAQ